MNAPPVPSDPRSAPTMRSVRRMTNLRAALREISPKPVGVDGLPIEAYHDPLGHLRWNPNVLHVHPELRPLEDVRASMVYGCIPDATKAVMIDGRQVEIGTISNRVIERAISRKLNAYLDRQFRDSSWGFRPRRSSEQAIVQVRSAIRQGAHWAFKTDIRKCFDNINRALLEEMLRKVLPDGVLVDAILSYTAPTVVRGGVAKARLDSIPQGNGISPILSNIYLEVLDEACSGLLYFRYADDLLLLFRTSREAHQAKAFISRVVSILGLELKPKKTFLLNLQRRPLVFLGYLIRGGNLYPSRKSISSFRRKLESRGLCTRKALMSAFVRRFRFCRVRMLFRRLDRDLVPLYPSGVSLVALWEYKARRQREKRRNG